MYVLKRYQEPAADLAARRNALAIYSFGLGKTIIGVESLRRIREANDNQGYYLIVCANRAREQWYAAVKEQCGQATHIEYCDAANRMPDIKKALGTVVIANWARLSANDTEWITDMPWTVAILDEVHRIRNHTSKRGKLVHKLDTNRRIGLTGTLFDKHVGEAWNILKWVRPGEYRSRRRFYAYYVEEETGFAGHSFPVGSKNLDRLAAEMAPFSVTVRAEDVIADLPPLTLERVFIPMLGPQARLYDNISEADDIVTKDDMLIANGLVRIIRQQQVSTDPLLLGFDMPSSKLEWLREWIKEDLDPGHQAAIFTRFRDTALRISQEFDIPCIVGGMPDGADAAFKSGEAQLIVGTIDSMSESLDWPNARTAIFLDQTWSSLQMSQAIHRIYRPAVETGVPKRVIFLHSTKSDQLVDTAIDNKWDERRLVAEHLALRGHQ